MFNGFRRMAGGGRGGSGSEGSAFGGGGGRHSSTATTTLVVAVVAHGDHSGSHPGPPSEEVASIVRGVRKCCLPKISIATTINAGLESFTKEGPASRSGAPDG